MRLKTESYSRLTIGTDAVREQLGQQMEIVVGRRKRANELGERTIREEEDQTSRFRHQRLAKLCPPFRRNKAAEFGLHLPVQDMLERVTPHAEATLVVSISGPLATKFLLL
jgi:hypothetical protein